MLFLAALLCCARSLPVLEFPRERPLAPTFLTSSQVVPGALNVHIQPHSHNDLGWLKTFDEYLSGQNNTIQQAGVKWIYQSIVEALQRDPNRRFISVEMGFLMRWLELQPPSVVADVQALVAADRLQLINSGWAMHDEACVSYSDAVDQMSLGARLAGAAFGTAAAARVAWSIDPFGHGATQGVLSSQMGHSGFFYGRLDWEEQAWQRANNATSYVWRPSASLGTGAQVFAESNFHGYDPPTLPNGRPLFEWDVVSDNPYRPALALGPLQPYPSLDGYNVDAFVNASLELADLQSAFTLPDQVDGTQHIAWQFGTDFNYAQAEMWFSQIDQLISTVNAAQSRVHLLYSTPRMYMDAKLAQRTAWPLKPATTDTGLSTDQFPLANNPHWVWSGYFSSRPALKHWVRLSSALFTSGRQLQAWTGGVREPLAPSNPLFALERALGTSTHHDAVTGTARQHVTYDYARQLSAGVEDAQALLSAALGTLTGHPSGNFSLCLLVNASICPTLEAPSPGDPPTLLLVYNGASTPRRAAPIRLPVGLPYPSIASWAVTAADGKAPLLAQLVPLSPADATLRERYYKAPARNISWLAWLAPEVPPLGFTSFFLTPSAGPVPHTHASRVVHLLPRSAPASGADEVISNGVVSLTLDGVSGKVARIEDRASGLSLPLAQALFYNRASPGCPSPLNIPYGCPSTPIKCNLTNDGTGANAWGQSSTTYIFRPNSTEEFSLGDALALEIIRGPVVSEARQTWPGGWASSALRLWGNSSAVEAEWTVGPVPLADGWGKEVFSRWSLGGGFGASDPAPTLYHDSMAREMQKRVLNARPFPNSTVSAYESIAANLYPVVARAVLRDAPTGASFTLAVDRAQACASLASGSVQCLLHRRHLTTAFLGMGEVLNEPGLDASGSGLAVRGAHLLRLGRESVGGVAEGSLSVAEELMQPLTMLMAPLPAAAAASLPQWAGGHTLHFQGLLGGSVGLPANLRVLTLQSLGGSALLLRVMHAFAAGEDPSLSSNATIALGPLFSPAFNITGVVETSLGGVVPLESVKPWTLRVQGEDTPVTLPILPSPPRGPAFQVSLSPMEVRTFICTVSGGRYE